MAPVQPPIELRIGIISPYQRYIVSDTRAPEDTQRLDGIV